MGGGISPPANVGPPDILRNQLTLEEIDVTRKPGNARVRNLPLRLLANPGWIFVAFHLAAPRVPKIPLGLPIYGKVLGYRNNPLREPAPTVQGETRLVQAAGSRKRATASSTTTTITTTNNDHRHQQPPPTTSPPTTPPATTTTDNHHHHRHNHHQPPPTTIMLRLQVPPIL